KLYSVHLGDCRLGLISEKKLKWLTYPHNLTMCRIVDIGILDLEEILRSSADNHIVTNSLNTKRLKKIEINVFNRKKGTYILATDGLWKLDVHKVLLTVKNKENYNEIDDLAFVIADE
ncbi:serine/threonine protein phosphatase, partial [Acinetobacter baumannii]|nr:serine/threonine protein phosphatase [Acinetobacter baumannii]